MMKYNTAMIIGLLLAAGMLQAGTLIFQNGTFAERGIIDISKSAVKLNSEGEEVFLPGDSKNPIHIPREKIHTVASEDGRVFALEEQAIEEKIQTVDETVVPVPDTRLPGFHRSIIRISALYIFNIDDNWLWNREKRNIEAYQRKYITDPLVLARYGYEGWRDNWSWAFDLDLMLPAIEFSQQKAFQFTGIKFGIRGRYGYSVTDSYLYNDEKFFFNSTIPDDKFYNARYLDYGYICGGPVVDFIFSSRYNNINLLLEVFLLYGIVTGGNFRPNASLGDVGIIYAPEDYRIGVSGYTWKFGFGTHFVLNRWVPIIIGLNTVFGSTRLRLARPPLSYGTLNSGPFMSGVGFEFVLGVHF